jgi:hypothetical protein
MTNYFECLHCGAFTRVMLTRPLCRECGCGTGFIRALSPEELAEARDKPGTGSAAQDRGCQEPFPPARGKGS